MHPTFDFCYYKHRYSYSQALVHIVVLSSEHNMTVGSRQYAWLEKDLIAVNRFITPWVVVEMHRPMYSEIDYLIPVLLASIQIDTYSLIPLFFFDQ